MLAKESLRCGGRHCFLSNSDFDPLHQASATATDHLVSSLVVYSLGPAIRPMELCLRAARSAALVHSKANGKIFHVSLSGSTRISDVDQKT